MSSSPLSKPFLITLCSLSYSFAGAQDLSSEIFDCLIEPKMSVLVGAPIQGIIDTLEVERNDLVEAGQVVATLRSEVEVAAMEHARVRATQARHRGSPSDARLLPD